MNDIDPKPIDPDSKDFWLNVLKEAKRRYAEYINSGNLVLAPLMKEEIKFIRNRIRVEKDMDY